MTALALALIVAAPLADALLRLASLIEWEPEA